MAKVPESPEELRLAIAAALGMIPGRCGEKHAVDAYRYALHRAWDRMAAVVGPLGAEAILQHAVKVASKDCPRAVLTAVGRQGLDLSKLEAETTAGGHEELCRCLQELYVATLHTLRGLTGEVLIGPLLDEARERQEERGAY